MYTAIDDFSNYYNDATIPADGAFEITFENVGDVDALLNDAYPLTAGKAITFGGKHPEIKRITNYRLVFNGTTGTTRNVVVIKTDVSEIAVDLKAATKANAVNCERL